MAIADMLQQLARYVSETTATFRSHLGYAALDDNDAVDLGKSLAAARLDVDVPFAVWQFERSRAAHDLTMVVVMAGALVDWHLFSSVGSTFCAESMERPLPGAN